ncbi:MAG: bifunctional oligoribonuclease/PAP phosphatase NrnA, partial [Gemmataceae bacterium]
WSPFVDLVDRARHFLLTTHIRPDGDGLGSMIALAEVLKGRGKQVDMVVASVLPGRYDFLVQGEVERFYLPGEKYQSADAIVVLDTGTWNQLADFGDFMKQRQAAKAVIDHHLTQDALEAKPFVDVTAEATGRLVFEALEALGARPLPRRAANALFIALAMDTGWFRHSNTTAKTFALAERLVQDGAQPEKIFDQLFEQNTLPRLKLMGLVLDRLEVTAAGKVAHTEIHRADYAATGALPSDSEDLVNYTRSVIGVEVGLLFMEQPAGGVKVSFRAREKVDVARIAEQFGGGGHRLASGAIVQAPLDDVKRRVLDAVQQALR